MQPKTLVVFPSDLWEKLTAHLRRPSSERMAFCYCGLSGPQRGRRFLVRELDLPDDSEYRSRNEVHVALRAEHAARRAVRVRQCRAFLDAHSHPFAAVPAPSVTDDRGAAEQHRALRVWAPEIPLIRMIFTPSGHVWAAVQTVPGGVPTPIDEIQVVGQDRFIQIAPVNAAKMEAVDRPSHLRTREVVGDHGIRALQSSRVAVVGLGGTGSVAARLLAGAGVGELYCIDGDTIETHNGPRLWYYAAGTEGKQKTAVLRRSLRRAFPGIVAEAIAEPFPGRRAERVLSSATMVVCCVDSRAIRYTLACWCSRRFLPLVDVGCGGRREDGRLTALGWQARLQTPGSACLACLGLDTRNLEDPATTLLKRRAGYIEGGGEISGELAVLTTRAAAEAVDIALRYITGYAPGVPRVIYGDALRFRATDASSAYYASAHCTICGAGPGSMAGTGEDWPGAGPPPEGGLRDAANE